MESTQDRLRKTLFSGDMPEMPQIYREYFNIAFMFRRKYLSVNVKSPENTYGAAVEDMRTICEAYDNNPFLIDLLVDCYWELERCLQKEVADVENQPKQCRMAL